MSRWLIVNRILAIGWVTIAVAKIPWLVQLLVDDFWRSSAVVYAALTGFGWIIQDQWKDDGPPWRNPE